MQDLNISFIQTSICWEDQEANLAHYSALLNKLVNPTDLILLPEMFNTGFSMDAPRLAEQMDGKSVTWLKETALAKNSTVIGSLIIEEKGNYYNRLIVAKQNGDLYAYNKRHLFRMANEDQTYSPGKDALIFEIKEWRIRPFVCYDLRFPVWSRNRFIAGSVGSDWEYDLAIYIANWPATRAIPWKTLPIARAIENQCYVATLNRVGKDGKGLDYTGDSQLINSYGEVILHLDHQENVVTHSISKSTLEKHRKNFPVGLDSDYFVIN